MNLFFISFLFLSFLWSGNSTVADEHPITIAILAKDKAHCLPLYLSCIEQQTWPKNKTYLYIRTNNNNDNSAEILKLWVQSVKDKYLDIYFDDSNLETNIQQYHPHEWNYERLKIMGTLRQQSIEWAYQKGSHYFVADCDNFIFPHTIEIMASRNLSIVAPLLHSNCAYSNFHAAIDKNGYYQSSPFYLPLVNQEIKGIIQVPVVHCTYFIRYEILPEIVYDDESYRYEYVIFSDNARKKNIPQYLDTTDVFGYLTQAEDMKELAAEPWFIPFCNTFYKNLVNGPGTYKNIIHT